jgi:thiamine-monophosphate kinase
MAPGSGEFDFIARLQRAVVSTGHGAPLGIGDDAALLRPAPGRLLVACVDTLVDGVHFPHGTPAADLGWKALAVNLSDLAAMGALPRWALLSLTLPEATASFATAFARGWNRLARRHGVALVGGDTTRGPLAVSVQLLGEVARSRALRRDAARAGDLVVVSGRLGDAAAGLAIIEQRLAAPDATTARLLRARLDRPTPRVELGRALGTLARAAIDVSDGLAQDLGHLLRASDVGATLDVDRLPVSPALRRAVPDPAARRALALSGGDDYELCFTVPASKAGALGALSRRLRVPLAVVGRIEARRGLRLRDASGRPVALSRPGFDHFRPCA